MALNNTLNSLIKLTVMPALLASLISCAVTPTGDGGAAATPAPAKNTSNEGDIRDAFDAYEKRQFADAYNAYERATASENVHAAQLAHLGKALIHLSTDAQWRDVNKAALSLQAAESVDAESNIETHMLINALSSLIGVEADISSLNRRVANSSVELGKLKEEREALLAEQDRLNAALERLKNLTIGN